MENLPIYPYRSIGNYYDGQFTHQYNIDKQSYLLLPGNKNYKIMTLPELKIKFLSPTFPHKIMFAFAYNEFVTISQERELIKMKYSHKVSSCSFS